MICDEVIRKLSSYERVQISGRAIFPDDPMVYGPGGYCGARIVKVIPGAELISNVRRWDSMGRIIDSAREYSL